MAHHGSSGGAGGGGLESTTPHIGTLTALSTLAVLGAGVWYSIAHPRKAFLAAAAATVMVVLMPAMDVYNPLYFLLIAGVGWWIATTRIGERPSETSDPDTQSRVDGK